MDTLRGPFDDYSGADPYDPAEDEIGREAPPQPVGQDERRMQVRAYNLWASLLGNRALPLITDLDTGHLPDFDPYSVLLDVSGAVDNAVVRYVGSAIAAESGCEAAGVSSLADVPGRSLLSRLTDHYMQILANQAPIGFEAEFTNQRGRTILYRGILLPFAADAASAGIDFIYGVISWKELADQQTTDGLMREIDKALLPKSPPARQSSPEPLVAWADGPMNMPAQGPADVLDLVGFDEAAAFGWDALAPGEGEVGLADLLASARELAEAAHGAEDRSRKALYAAIGRAHEFALAAAAAPEDFAELVEDAGLAVQERAPLIPVVKLVFGAGYDKTRLTEYATAIGHAQRLGLAAGALGALLESSPGGLKGVVQRERRLRREGQSPAPGRNRESAVVRRLRDLPARPLADLDGSGDEFTLVLARRTGDGDVLMIGEVAGDAALLERAARRLLG